MVAKKIKISQKRKIALVCSGGAAKAGAFHLGVALALQEKGFSFAGGLKKEPEVKLPEKCISVYVGSSAGSIITSLLASGYSLDQIFDSFLGKKSSASQERELKRLTYSIMFSLKKENSLFDALSSFKDIYKLPTFSNITRFLAKDTFEAFMSLKFLKWSGFFTTAGIEKYLREQALPSNDFHSFAADLFIVATQLNHSKKVVFGKYKFQSSDKTVAYMDDCSISDACAASTALPLIFSPYPIRHEKGNKVYYFDGEIRDTLSTHVGCDAGADLVIASYTHQPYHYSKEIGSLHEYGIPAILIQALYLMIERKIQSAIFTQEKNAIVLNTVNEFFKNNNIDDEKRKSCLEALENKLGIKLNTDFIYIHPKPSNHQMFFGDHFNLSAKKMSEIVRLGFKCGVEELRKYDFE